MSSVSRPCPTCGRETSLLAGVIVYPGSKDWAERTALVCWPCNQVRRRGEPWQQIDARRHTRQWKAERKKWKDKE